MMLKEFLPRLLRKEVLTALPRLTKTEQELAIVKQDKECLQSERNHLVGKTESLLADYEQEKKEKFSIMCTLTEARQQLQQQGDYCSSLGRVCGELLWKVSQNEESVQNILTGAKVAEFLSLVNNTIVSYLSTYGTDVPEETSEESQFVLSLCGTVTNIAASAFGRDYLATSDEGKELLETLCNALASSPLLPQCAKLRSLMLMFLYNISINQNGLKCLNARADLLPLLVWIAQEDLCVSNKVHCLRLLQSLLLEPANRLVIRRAIEAIPSSFLQELSSSSHHELHQAACELMADLQSLQQNT